MRTLGHNPTKEELDELIKQYDADESGTIDFNEFMVLMNNKLKEQQEGQELLETFQIFDKDADGYINAEDIKNVRDWVGENRENLDDDLILELIEQADRDGDGKINYHEFVRIMTMK
jgi:Ca2+-binding EF-hand superfamily protein